MEISINIPDYEVQVIRTLFKKEPKNVFREKIISKILKEQIVSEIRDISNNLSEYNKMIRKFEKKYGMDFANFKKKLMDPEFADIDAHEDFIEWKAYMDGKIEVENRLRDLEGLLKCY
ncbi:MAG: hypothetical protein ACE5KT_04500 [Methanosarcinales archaeon]